MKILIAEIYDTTKKEGGFKELVIDLEKLPKDHETLLKEIAECTGVPELIKNSMLCKARNTLSLSLDLDKFITLAQHLVNNKLITEIDYTDRLFIGCYREDLNKLEADIMLMLDGFKTRLSKESLKAIFDIMVKIREKVPRIE